MFLAQIYALAVFGSIDLRVGGCEKDYLISELIDSKTQWSNFISWAAVLSYQVPLLGSEPVVQSPPKLSNV